MKMFTPNLMVKDLQALPLEALQAQGIENLLFDVDNTIVPYNSQGLTQETIDWFETVSYTHLKLPKFLPVMKSL